MKLNARTMAIITVGTFIVGIAGSSLLGIWKTTSTKVPVTIKEGEFAGNPNPADIRGSYTWTDVAKAFSFDVSYIVTAFSAADPLLKVNTLEELYVGAPLPEGTEIGTDSVRSFVSLMTGLPHTPEEGTLLPGAAIAVLKEFGKADPALIEEAAAKAYYGAVPAAAAPETTAPVTTAAPAAAPATVPAASAAAPAATKTATAPAAVPAAVPATVPAVAAPAPVSAPATTTAPAASTETHTVTVGTVTGKTTFKDIKDWGLTNEEVKLVTEGKVYLDSVALRDWSSANGVAFADRKTKVQERLDAKK